MKTVRFVTLIQKCGKPVHHLAWGEPKKDPILKKAAGHGRLLTVHQKVRGSIKDFGIVGFQVAPDAQYFAFPKNLRAFANTRVVAIRYDLADESFGFNPSLRPVPRAKLASRPPKAPPPSSGKSTAPSAQSEEDGRNEEPLAPLTRRSIAAEVNSALREIRHRRIASATKRLGVLSKQLEADSEEI